jgi:hypothetical protein
MKVLEEPVYVTTYVGECRRCGALARSTVEAQAHRAARTHRRVCGANFGWSTDFGQPVGYQLALTICDA